MNARADVLQLVVGHVYEAKRPTVVGLFDRFINDRQILWVGLTEVQYDSPTVRPGWHYPKISAEAFRNWAARDVTHLMPRNEWRHAPEDARAGTRLGGEA
ncbi:hypothetical protein [Rhodanobacter lindaniclasticus]